MVDSMDEVARVAAGNAGALDAVVSTSSEQVASMADMVTSSKSLTELAEQLRVVLRGFDTGGAPRSAARETGLGAGGEDAP
jgi:methyl-accepting chemotaxis protein